MNGRQVSMMKSISSMIAIAGLLLAYPLAASALITVVADYNLGESDPGAVAGNAGDATTIDSSGNGNNLTQHGSNSANLTYSSDVAASAALHTGSTISMAGFTRVTTPGTGAYYQKASPDTTATDNFGIEAWFKFTTAPTAGLNYFVAYNGTLNGPNNGYGIVASDSSGFIAGEVRGLNEQTTITPVVNTWYYVAFVDDGGTGKVYVNSAGVTPAFTQAGIVNVTPTGFFTIGANDLAGDGGFNGLIDEVRVFTFAPGAFSTSDLLINQTVPEPASLGLLLLAAPLVMKRRK